MVSVFLIDILQVDFIEQLSKGIVAGAGLELSTGIGHFLVEGRYYYGLGDFYHNAKKDEFGRSGHSYIGVRLTYLYDIIK